MNNEERRKRNKNVSSIPVYSQWFLVFSIIIDKESSSGEEYGNEEEEDDDDDDESIGDSQPQNRRSSAAKRKSIAIQSKDKTESWGNYRNTIDNGPVPRR
jgi:hypothetical protein